MPQESNGVGSIRSFLKILSEDKEPTQKVKQPRKISWIVGKLVYEANSFGKEIKFN